MAHLPIYWISILFLAFTQVQKRSAGNDCQMSRADVLFILDESTSIWPDNYNRQKEFIIKMIKSYDVGPGRVNIGVLSFATDAVTRFNFNSHKTRDTMIEAVSKFKQLYGDTHTWEVMQLARNSALTEKNGSRRGNVPQVVIVITDGNSQEPDLTAEESERTRRETGVTMFAIGIGDRISRRELLNIAGSKDRIITVRDYKQLLDKQLTILDEACLADQGKCGGRHGADLAFVMDTPNAGRIDLIDVNEFMRVVVRELDIGPDTIRVASIHSDCTKLVDFELNSHSTKEQVLETLQIKSTSKSGRLESLLNETLTRTFTKQYGARTDAKKVVILVTDGSVADVTSLRRESRRMKAANVEVFVIGVGDKVDQRVLIDLATDDKHFFLVSDYESLRSKKNALISGICKAPNNQTRKRLLSDLEELARRLV